MYIKAIDVDPYFLELILDHFKTQETCDKAVKEDSFSLQYFPNSFVTRGGCGCGVMTIMMMMVIIRIMIMMKINFLSGMMGIKNGRLKKQK